MRRAIAFGLILLLAGCAGGTGGLGFLRGATEKVAVANKNIVISGPDGYCVETSATRDAATGSFVLLGSCASVTGNHRANSPKVLARLTASVSGPGAAGISGSLDGLEDFFTSDNGRETLARDGKASSVEILSSEVEDDGFYMRVRDTSTNLTVGESTDYWRALFDLRGRIVTLSVVGFSRMPLSEADGLQVLRAFSARIHANNPPILSGDEAGNERNGLLQRFRR